MEAIIKSGQSLHDVAAKLAGSGEAAVAIAQQNGLAVDAQPHAGTVLQYSGEVVDQDTANYYSRNTIEAGTALSSEDEHVRLFDFVFDDKFE